MQSEPSQHTLTLPLLSADEDNVCLPLVINVVSRYWGEELSLSEAEQMAKKYSSISGSIMIEGIDLAEKHGLAGFAYRGSISDLKRKIDQGIPIIVILPGIRETIQHANIVCGYDANDSRILTYVPVPDTLGAIPESVFQQEWEQDDMVSIVLVPQDLRHIIEKENPRRVVSNRICLEVERLRHKGKTQEALNKLSKAVEIDDDNAQAWCTMGSIFNEQNSEEAVSCYHKCIERNPIYYLAFRGLGNYYLKKKDYSRAEEYFSEALNINPKRFGPIFKNRALARLQLGDKKGCKDDLVRYLEQVPNANDKTSIQEALAQL